LSTSSKKGIGHDGGGRGTGREKCFPAVWVEMGMFRDGKAREARRGGDARPTIKLEKRGVTRGVKDEKVAGK